MNQPSRVEVPVPEGSEVVVVPQGRRVVTVPRGVTPGLVWRVIQGLIVVSFALCAGTAVSWWVQDAKSCAARREGTLDVARSVERSARTTFAADPAVSEGLMDIARDIRHGAEKC